MKVKLRELYNTKYFYKTFVIDLDYLFDNIALLRTTPSLDVHPVNDEMKKIFDAARIGTELVFDLAECRITPDCVRCIMSGMSKGIKFCDTSNPSRDAILFEDANRIAIRKDEFVNLPEFKLGSSVKEYIASLSKDVTYKIPLVDKNIYLPLAYMAQCCRPTINIAPCSLELEYMRFIGSNLTINDLEPFDEFYYATKEGVRVAKVNKERQLYDQTLGLVGITEALSVGVLVPTVFGNINTLHTRGFDLLFDRCLKSVQAQSVTQKFTLEQFFG